MYLKEYLIIGSVWFLCFISLFFIPKSKRREASAIVLITQLPTWILGLLVVEAGWIEYPVRELSRANSTSFSFEYIVMPLICVFFNFYYPEKKTIFKKLSYYGAILSVFTCFEVVVEKYTQVLTYLNWNWYCTFVGMGIVMYMVRVSYKWLYHMKKPLSL